MSERHPDAHWDCENCGEPLIRAAHGIQVPGAISWVYSSAINGERYCREPVGTPMPHWPSHREHNPAPVDLSTIDKVEEYLSS